MSNPTDLIERPASGSGADRERYRLKQNGIPVAWAEGPTALVEINHYALVYGQDGPVDIEVYRSGKWRKYSPASPVSRR